MAINLTNIDEVMALQSNLRATFETPQGREAMKFIEQIGSWTPTIFDTLDTNEVIARDANRRLIGTLKSLLEHSPEIIVNLACNEK